ncbi:tyrosine-type recombinase/integrase [Shewanella litorisediminis]|uniref:Site-specific integrase n=1 Tax=Shewanella litorisediminis TaxID=1173586 RepID=A0ABX7G4G1_9GAMM|nr:site-specific integrase [Shewanella litorisediminis]MCL2919959.1 site-specific integrase [Shewanella litorisediminis]QRH02133.1 site-specific integrase [Shewanella litorisediminis]
MNHAQLKKIAKSGSEKKDRVADNLYIKPLKSGDASFIYRGTVAGKRIEIVLGQFGNGPGQMSLLEAKNQAAELQRQVKEGKNPKLEIKKLAAALKDTFDSVAQDHFEGYCRTIKHPDRPRALYKNHIVKALGDMPVSCITRQMIRNVVNSIDAGDKRTANGNALRLIRKILDHAIELGMLETNVATGINLKSIGVKEESRERNLSFEEIPMVLEILRDHVSWDNYLAFILLLILGVRKNELLQAKWTEFDLEKQIWALPKSRGKTNTSIRIAIPEPLMPILLEVKERSGNSDYLFPARRSGSKTAHIGRDTLNAALSKVFGKENKGKKSKPLPNLFEAAGIEHFTVHDFRRTCASRLADLGTTSDVIEKVLNHVVPGVKGTYNRSDYLQDRLEAQTKLCEKLGIASALVKLTVTDAEVAEEVETQVKSTAEPATITSPAPVSTTNKMAACKSPPPSATNEDSTSPISQSNRPSTLSPIPYNFAPTKDVTYGNSVVFNSLRLSGESLTEATDFISPPPPG